MLQTTPST